MIHLTPMRMLDLPGLVHLSKACGPDITQIMQEITRGTLHLYRARSARASGTVALRLEQVDGANELVIVAVGGQGTGLLRALDKPIRAIAQHHDALTIRAHTKMPAMARLHRLIGFTNQIRQGGEFVSFAGA